MNSVILLGKSDFWQRNLLQAGIPFFIYNESGCSLKSADMLILNRLLTISELELLKSKINEDTFLIYTPVWGRLVRTIRRNEKFINRGMEYRFDTKAEVYEFSKPLRKGEAFFNLDFKLTKADKTRRRKFYHENVELPDERVQSVNHFEIFRYFNNFLADCFIDKDQVLQAYSPLPDDMPLFIFRIDTDFADFNRIKALFILCEHYNISATWFVDVHSKEILDYYGSFRNQEIALHCDRHYLYKDAASNRANIKSGMDILMKHNIYPSGFAAPFGDWNSELENVLLEFEFIYSSEFAFAYDALPYIINKEGKNIVQIPIHPVSPGRLLRSHFTMPQMLDYYLKEIEACRRQNRPAIIYHHPSHDLNYLLEVIFEYIVDENYQNITMLSYADWWLRRYEALQNAGSDELMSIKPLFPLNRNFPEDYQRIYHKDWHWYLHELEAYRGKYHFKKLGYPKRLLKV
jgi:hypothetical protein